MKSDSEFILCIHCIHFTYDALSDVFWENMHSQMNNIHTFDQIYV